MLALSDSEIASTCRDMYDYMVGTGSREGSVGGAVGSTGCGGRRGGGWQSWLLLQRPWKATEGPGSPRKGMEVRGRSWKVMEVTGR